MNSTTYRIAVTAALFALAQAWSQDPKQALQQRLAEIKQSMAQNQAQLRQYAWTETTEISLKGEAKKREQNECRYGPDGKVVKTPIGEAAPPKKAPRGLKGKVVKNKLEDLKEYMDRVGSLVKRYVPPDPQAMQAAFQAGKASLSPGGSVASLVFSDYAKPGDNVTLAFDTAAKKLKSFQVATYLDEPADAVTLVANFSSLADGTSYLEQSVLDAKAKEIQIKTTNFGHKKSAN